MHKSTEGYTFMQNCFEYLRKIIIVQDVINSQQNGVGCIKFKTIN